MSDEFDALASLWEADVRDLSTMTFENLAQTLLNQGPDRVHQDEDQHSAIQHEEFNMRSCVSACSVERDWISSMGSYRNLGR
jgi:hypothetical protein